MDWTALRGLPLAIESCEYERLSAPLAYGRERVTTLLHLRGGGEEGLSEDVGVMEDDKDALHVTKPDLGLAGEWTLGSLCEHLHATDQFPVEPSWEVMRRWRNWAFESAALDLALRQAGRALHEVLGREPRPLRFVNSLGLGEEPSFDPIRRRLEHHPGLRFKVDAHPAWTPELIAELAATSAVDIVDFKGAYGLEVTDEAALIRMYERVVRAFPDALLEDPHDLPEVTALLEGERHRISYDAPIHTAADIDAQRFAPRAVNIKPCRVGDMRSLLDVYATVAERGLVTYGGGMGELSVGRGQIQLLASLFHPDGPNDTAPSGYNTDTPAPELPASPLDPQPERIGFRRRIDLP
jgi:L-alanine-DL-glutamate epimerase-like enolase superfamily enzyme